MDHSKENMSGKNNEKKDDNHEKYLSEENSAEKLLNFLKENGSESNNKEKSGTEKSENIINDEMLDEYEKILETFSVPMDKKEKRKKQNSDEEKTDDFKDDFIKELESASKRNIKEDVSNNVKSYKKEESSESETKEKSELITEDSKIESEIEIESPFDVLTQTEKSEKDNGSISDAEKSLDNEKTYEIESNETDFELEGNYIASSDEGLFDEKVDEKQISADGKVSEDGKSDLTDIEKFINENLESEKPDQQEINLDSKTEVINDDEEETNIPVEEKSNFTENGSSSQTETKKYFRKSNKKKSREILSGIKYFSLKETYLLIDIGDSTIKIIEVMPGKNSENEIYSLLHQEIPLSIIDHPEKKEELLTGYLRNLLAEKSFKADKAYLVLSMQGIISRRVEISVVEESELEDAVGWELNKIANIDLEKAYYVYEKVADSPRGTSIVAYICSKEIINSYEHVFNDLGLGLLGILPTSYSISGFYDFYDRYKDYSICHLEIGAQTTLVSFVKNNRLIFSREMLTAGKNFTEVLMSPLSPGESKKRLTYEKAEKLKKEIGIPYGDMLQQTEDGISYSQIAILVRPVLERLMSGVQRTIEYVRAEFKIDTPASRIILSGGSAELKNIEKEFAQRFNLPVEKMNAFDAYDYISFEIEKNYDKGISFLPLIGALHNDKKKINFYPESKRAVIIPYWIKFYQKIVLPLLTIILSVSAVLFYSLFSNVNEAYQNEFQTVQKLEEKSIIHDQLSAEIAELNNQLDWLAVPKPLNLPWMEIFKEISGLISEDIYITNLKLGSAISERNKEYIEENTSVEQQQNTAFGENISTAAPDKGIALEGIIWIDNTKSAALDILTNFMLELEKSSFFTDIFLEEGIMDPQNPKVLNFNIILRFE